MMLTILNYTPDAVVPLNTEQEAPMVEIGVTDLEGGSYHFSQEVTNVQVPPTPMYVNYYNGCQLIWQAVMLTMWTLL